MAQPTANWHRREGRLDNLQLRQRPAVCPQPCAGRASLQQDTFGARFEAEAVGDSAAGACMQSLRAAMIAYLRCVHNHTMDGSRVMLGRVADLACGYTRPAPAWRLVRAAAGTACHAGGGPTPRLGTYSHRHPPPQQGHSGPAAGHSCMLMRSMPGARSTQSCSR